MNTSSMAPEAILPGGWIGVLGGGQLGRMMTHAAQAMGYHVAIWDADSNGPGAQAANRFFSSEAPDALREFGQLCDVITLEFENIDKRIVQELEETTPVRPGANFLEIAQDRVREKSSLKAIGIGTTPFHPVASLEDAQTAGDSLGWPMVLKTATSGYDGKGQVKVESPDELSGAWEKLGSTHAVAEAWITYEAEVSMIAARTAQGSFEHFPLLENEHANHILDVTRCPARKELRHWESKAAEVCRTIADEFEVAGLFCVEFFVADDLLVNEIAPRPHNSGHLTIDAFACSQFEQQVRAICGLPLANPVAHQPAAMVNLLGELWQPEIPDWQLVLDRPQTHLHLYGKSAARTGRKMGHITVLDENVERAVENAKAVREQMVKPAVTSDPK